MKIKLEQHNPYWKGLFEIEKESLGNAIQENIIIEHIGSTSIDGLMAKPIVDIMVGLENFDNIDCNIFAMEKLGYNYISKYENEMPYRKFFTKEKKGVRTHNIHMVRYNSEFWNRHLKFRDHIRSNKFDKLKYQNLKLNLVKESWANVNEYANAKSKFIRSIENK